MMSHQQQQRKGSKRLSTRLLFHLRSNSRNPPRLHLDEHYPTSLSDVLELKAHSGAIAHFTLQKSHLLNGLR
ncbi:hypothetical protein ACLKA6_019631 [Drosophila palustris]